MGATGIAGSEMSALIHPFIRILARVATRSTMTADGFSHFGLGHRSASQFVFFLPIPSETHRTHTSHDEKNTQKHIIDLS